MRLNITVNGKGAVSGGGHRVTCAMTACSTMFNVHPGTVKLKAVAASTWKFTTWDRGCHGNTPTCSLRIQHSTRVAATFVPPGARQNPYALGRAVKLEGGWRLTVHSAILNADTEVAAVIDEDGRPANSPPKPGAQYTLVNVSLYLWR